MTVEYTEKEDHHHRGQLHPSNYSNELSKDFFPNRIATITVPKLKNSDVLDTNTRNPVASQDEKTMNKILNTITQHHWNDLIEMGSVMGFPHVVQHVLIKLQTRPKLALELLNWAESQLELKPDLHSLCIVIHILAKARMSSYAQELLKRVLNFDFGSTHLIFDNLVATYKACNSTPFVFDLFIRTLVYLGMLNSAVEVFGLMKNYEFIPAIETCNGLLGALLKAKEMDSLWIVNAEMLRSKISFNAYTFNIMINALCKQGKLTKAKKVLEDMEVMGCRPTVVSYTTVIDAHCKRYKVEDGLKLLSVMFERNIFPDVLIYSSVIKGLCKDGRVDEASGCLTQMMEKGLMPNDAIYNVLIDGYCNKSNTRKAFELRNSMLHLGIQPSVCTYNALIRGLLIEGKIAEVKDLVDKMSEMDLSPDEITYNILIDGYFKAGELEEAFKNQAEMLGKGFFPIAATYTSLICGLCTKGNMEDAEWLLKKITAKGLNPNGITYNTLISGHCNIGNIERALDLMHEMGKRNIFPDDVTYNTLFYGLCQIGEVKKAQQLLGKMIKRGTEASHITYNILISGYCKKGDMQEACRNRKWRTSRGALERNGKKRPCSR
ncbi:hypothetical protein SUGI_0810390 [Cryptomeria japonica]|nr:hypothetical protein SUGI_0810390 [Cryptomeria japonica]